MTVRVVTVVGLVVFVLIVLVPFWWIASMSFKTYEQVQFATSIYVPRPFTWENYTALWTATRFPLWLRNSAVTAVLVTLVTTVVASLAGYAVARLRFPGRESFASLILVLYLVPPALLFIPLYRVLAELGATNSLAALVLSYPTFTVPFCTWLLIGFFKALPTELEEAVLVDGATRAQALVRVLLPLAAPGIVASAIFAFTLSWNEFLYALIFIQDETMTTVPFGLNLLIYGDVFPWGQLMAASVITTVPVVRPIHVHPSLDGRGAGGGLGEGLSAGGRRPLRRGGGVALDLVDGVVALAEVGRHRHVAGRAPRHCRPRAADEPAEQR